MRSLAPALTLLALGGCGGNEPATTTIHTEEMPRGDVFVARSRPAPTGPDGQPAPARMALFHGHYAVAKGCLVFDTGGDEPALVRFALETPIHVYSDRVVIAGQTHRFDRPESIGSGFDGGHEMLATPPPPQCAYSVIGP